MMTINHNNRRKGCWGRRGFSLLELMLVVAILGALAAAVGVYINNEDAKLKSFVFNMGTRFKQAKFEAMKRGRAVYLDFDLDRNGTISNGYTIWADNDNNSDYDEYVDVAHGAIPANGICDQDEGDCVIDEVVFPNLANPDVARPGPEIYNGAAAFPTGGPEADGPGTKDIGDGIAIAGGSLRFQFQPSGDSTNGTVYIYFPRGEAGAEEVAAGPWAIIINLAGRVRMDEWKSGTGWKVNE